MNLTDPDTKRLKAREGYVQGFNAQAVVDEGQIVLAAEITNSNTDWSQLAPMITATIAELARAGVASKGGRWRRRANARRRSGAGAPPGGQGELPGDGDPFALVAALFEQIGDRDRVILGADLAVAVVVDEKAIAAEPVVTGSLAGMNEGRGANEGPVQVLDAAVVVEGRGLGERFRLPLLRKAGVSISRLPGATSGLPAPPTTTSLRTPAPRSPSTSAGATSASV